MDQPPGEPLGTAFERAIQALEKMLATLHRTARTAAHLQERGVARRLDELAGDVETSLRGLRSRAAAVDRANTIASRRNGR